MPLVTKLAVFIIGVLLKEVSLYYVFPIVISDCLIYGKRRLVQEINMLSTHDDHNEGTIKSIIVT